MNFKASIYILLVLTLCGFNQINQLTKDFIKDNDGKLGLRAKHITKKKTGDVYSYFFDGIIFDEYFNNKSKKEIFDLLGKPNHFIKKGHITKEEGEQFGYDVDIIEYTISSDSIIGCITGHSYGLPSPINTINFEKNNFNKGQLKSVGVDFFFNCSNHKKDRKENVLLLRFWFYLGTEYEVH